MTDLHLPWLEMGILIPLLGGLLVGCLRDPLAARKWSLVACGMTLVCVVSAWQDFGILHATRADDPGHVLAKLIGREIFIIDELSAPLLPLVALLYFLVTIATMRTKVRRFSFSWMLFSEALLLATFSCSEPWLVIALLALGTVPPFFELRARKRCTRMYALYMLTSVGLMVLGQLLVTIEGETGGKPHALWAVIPILFGVLIRCGTLPFHTWTTDLFEKATFGTALLFLAPITGAYAAVRLVLPVAPDAALRIMGLMSLITAAYSAAMALVQRDGRRFFCFLLLSHSSMVLVGLEMLSLVGLTGALSLWLSVGISLGGFGITMRALEARRGRLGLVEFQGLYENTPALAVCFLLTGLACVGFPLTIGFVGTELLIDDAVKVYIYIGAAVVVASAMNGIAMVQAFFLLFTGTRHVSAISLKIGVRERFAVLTLAALVLLGGVFPQPGVVSRYNAAKQLTRERTALVGDPKQVPVPQVTPGKKAIKPVKPKATPVALAPAASTTGSVSIGH